MPLRNLQDYQCVGRCRPGKAAVNGVCLDCRSPCAECRNSVNKCTKCRDDVPEKYHFGSLCYEVCPKRTITDELNRRCLGCEAGCEVCDKDDQLKCLQCIDELLLFNNTCLKTCPTGYVPNFFFTECVAEDAYPIIWFPGLIFTFLMFVMA